MSGRKNRDLKEYFAENGAAGWWDTGKIYLNERDLLVLEYVSRERRETNTVLDLGAGKGRITVPLAAKGFQAIALDVSMTMLQKAVERTMEHNLRRNIDFILGDAENLPFREKAFDVIICIETLMHVPSISDVISEIWRVSRLEGVTIADATILENLLHSGGLRLFLKAWLVKHFRHLIPVIPRRKIIWKALASKEFYKILESQRLEILETVDFRSSRLAIARKI